MILPTRLLFWAEAMTVCPTLILIRPERRDDEALIAHEQVHVAQMTRMGTFRFWWHYLTSRDFRLFVEVEAYRVQIAAGGLSPAQAAAHLTRYRTGVTLAQALTLLKDPS